MKTTQPPCADVLSILPTLQVKTTTRLHPRPVQAAPNTISNLGGEFLWPKNEPWPSCDMHNVPYVGILQLYSRDVPLMQYPEGKDLFQLLWCPYSHSQQSYYGPLPVVFWRDSTTILQPLSQIPRVVLGDEGCDAEEGPFIPSACELHPEPVDEYPEVSELEKHLVEKLEQWDLPASIDVRQRYGNPHLAYHGYNLYFKELSVAPGTKIGGYVHWTQFPRVPRCHCDRVMEHLLTIASSEPLDSSCREFRWLPVEERDLPIEERKKLARGTGLMLGDGGCIYLFICHHCQPWPIQWREQSG